MKTTIAMSNVGDLILGVFGFGRNWGLIHTLNPELISYKRLEGLLELIWCSDEVQSSHITRLTIEGQQKLHLWLEEEERPEPGSGNLFPLNRFSLGLTGSPPF